MKPIRAFQTWLAACALLGRLGDIREQVALQHVRGRQRQPAVVHGLEDRVGVVVGVGGDLDEVHVLDEPVGEVRQCRTHEVLGKDVFKFSIAREDVGNRLRRVRVGELLTFVKRFHASRALWNVQIE